MCPRGVVPGMFACSRPLAELVLAGNNNQLVVVVRVLDYYYYYMSMGLLLLLLHLSSTDSRAAWAGAGAWDRSAEV